MANSLITIKGLTNLQLDEVQAKLQTFVDTIWPEAKVEVDDEEKDDEFNEEPADEELPNDEDSDEEEPKR